MGTPVNVKRAIKLKTRKARKQDPNAKLVISGSLVTGASHDMKHYGPKRGLS